MESLIAVQREIDVHKVCLDDPQYASCAVRDQDGISTYALHFPMPDFYFIKGANSEEEGERPKLHLPWWNFQDGNPHCINDEFGDDVDVPSLK